MVQFLSCTFLVFCLLLQEKSFAQKESEIQLYANEVPNTLKSTLPERAKFSNNRQLIALSNVINPRLLVFKPETSNGTGIIICPGGGYGNLNIENVRFIAHRLMKMGITSFVLTYRLPADSLMVDKSIGAIQDIQQALRIVRQKAGDFKLNLNRIGVWGSSAGGHLAAMAGTHWNKSYNQKSDTTGLRPDFLILAWPVISFREGVVHMGSMLNLLGENPSEQQLSDYSADEQVNSRTPPTFLVHASDDPTVPVNNSIRFYQALKKHNVSAELHIYEKGGHGFGISPDVKNSWMSQLEIWFTNRGLIPSFSN